MNTAWFQINISHNCNLQCSHCRVVDNSTPELVMPNWMMERIVDVGEFVYEKYNIAKIKATILGGEPLMYMDRVLALVGYLKDIRGPELTLWLFTNGHLLTQDIMNQLADENVFVLLSSNQEPESFLFKKCEIIEKRQAVTRMAICMDRANMLRLPQMVERIFKNGWSVRLFADNNGFEDLDFFTLYKNVVPETLDIIDHYEKDASRLLYLYENFDPRAKEEKSLYLVGKSILVFDPDGVVRSSTPMRDIGVLGNLINPNDYFYTMRHYPFRAQRIPRWSAQYIRECDGCSVRAVCQGGYPVPRWGYYKRFDKPTPYCELFKLGIPKFVNMYKNKI